MGSASSQGAWGSTGKGYPTAICLVYQQEAFRYLYIKFQGKILLRLLVDNVQAM